METPKPDTSEYTDYRDAQTAQGSSYERARASFLPSGGLSEELRQRIISALVLVAIFLTLEIIGGIFFAGLVLVASLLMLREWDELTEGYGGYWPWYGIAYITLPALCLIWLRNISLPETPHAGMGIVLYLVLIVAATDIGAYIVGKKIGRTKLAPKISPGKTWEGLAGGVIAAGAFGFVIAIFTPFPSSATHGCIIGMILAFAAQLGDLFESWLKRKAGVKDSGTIIPGHGGVLDRVDGLLSASVLLAIITLFSGYGY